ncbi:MAG: LLM class flavin-dependent oxidoreductase [Candidatus Promineifilaceae bacterium]
MKLSILDQSPIRHGGTAHDAVTETIALAQAGEKWGYERFWIAEHHNTNSLASSAPEVLLAAVGAHTNSIRLGSGGVMLPHYAAFKVAETFSMLATLYPERVDLGIGRAPGSDMETARVLASDGVPKFDRFPQLVQNLRVMLTDRDFRPKVTPRPPSPPPIWMLGSSPESANLAGHLGLPYNFALFINNKMSPQIFQYYRTQFKPSEQLEKPRTILTINVVCAETEEKAKRLAMPRALGFLKFVTKRPVSGIPTIEEAENFPYTPQETAFIRDRAYQSAVGTPKQVKAKIEQLASAYQADEIMALTITHDFEDRLRSYELLAEQFM